MTFVFTDIEGSTRLARSLGPRYREVLTEHRRVLRECLCGTGAELLTEGDSFFVAFADPRAAVRACLRAQRALAEHDWPNEEARPRVRMGLHTGYAEAHHGEYASPEVHRAARIAAAAHGDQVLCSETTAVAVRRESECQLIDLGRHRLRGFDDRIRIYQLAAAGLARDFPQPRTADRRRHNLPEPITRLIGRAAERVELGVLTRGQRLVTVWGTGGVGKTRLAVEAARDAVSRYPGGVWFADLAGADRPDRVATLVAEALGVRPGVAQSVTAALVEELAGHETMLLLDTCERQRDAVAALASRLLAACPRLRVLATSRVPLGVAGELVWRLAPLSVDGTTAGADHEALDLLLDRVGGPPAPDRIAGLDRLARQLGGLPLALELAVPLLRTMPPGMLSERLVTGAGGLLTRTGGAAGGEVDGPSPARHHSLRANVDWSDRLLSRPASRLLRWLSAWPGAVDLNAVEWLTGGWLDLADGCAVVAELVDAALLEAQLTETSATYRMLYPVRVEARRLAAEDGELTAARARCQSWSHRGAAAPPPTLVRQPVAASR